MNEVSYFKQKNGRVLEIKESELYPEERMVRPILPEHIYLSALDESRREGISIESVVISWCMKHLEYEMYCDREVEHGD